MRAVTGLQLALGSAVILIDLNLPFQSVSDDTCKVTNLGLMLFQLTSEN